MEIKRQAEKAYLEIPQDAGAALLFVRVRAKPKNPCTNNKKLPAIKRAFQGVSSKMYKMYVRKRGKNPYLYFRRCPSYQVLRDFSAFSYENA